LDEGLLSHQQSGDAIDDRSRSVHQRLQCRRIRRRKSRVPENTFDFVTRPQVFAGKRHTVAGQRQAIPYDNLTLCRERRQHVIEHV
jgi:hypothetical protein